jgi:multidrug efflux system membrane fusion protein
MALMQASAQRLRDEAQLEHARVTLQRYQTLLAQDSIARQEVDTQAALVKQLEATVAADRAAEGTARLNVGYARVTAPISGRVGLRTVDVGNLVGSNDANGIAVITQLAPIDVEFAIPQDRVPEVQARVRAGASMPVTALDRTRTEPLATGTFSTLDNVVDPQTGTVRAKARFQNAGLTLFPNQFVNVRLLLRTLEGATVVPLAAVRHGSNGNYVYVLNAAERTASLRPVQQGQMTADRVVILSGVQAGEQVITEGADRLRDGARVVLPGDTPGAGQRRGAEGAPGPRGDGAGRQGARGDGAGRQGARGGAAGAEGGASGAPGDERRRRRSADGASTPVDGSGDPATRGGGRAIR